jgi:hypothetical protein
MTIKRGQEWGHVVSDLAGAVEVHSDAELVEALGPDSSGGPVRVRGGDLHRSLGSPDGSAGTRLLPIDLIAIEADGRPYTAVAHAVARRGGRSGWWLGAAVAVMNVDHLGRWDIAPRAHPNDGWLEVLEVSASMSLRARWQASRRLPTGSHVPHPDISTRRVRETSFTFEPALTLWVDGVERGPVQSLRVRVVADAAEVYV